MEAVIANVTNTGSVGFKCAGIWHFLQGCGTIGIVIRVVDMGPDDPDFPDPWGLPPQGVLLAERETSTATS